MIALGLLSAPLFLLGLLLPAAIFSPPPVPVQPAVPPPLPRSNPHNNSSNHPLPHPSPLSTFFIDLLSLHAASPGIFFTFGGPDSSSSDLSSVSFAGIFQSKEWIHIQHLSSPEGSPLQSTTPLLPIKTLEYQLKGPIPERSLVPSDKTIVFWSNSLAQAPTIMAFLGKIICQKKKQDQPDNYCVKVLFHIPDNSDQNVIGDQLIQNLSFLNSVDRVLLSSHQLQRSKWTEGKAMQDKITFLATPSDDNNHFHFGEGRSLSEWRENDHLFAKILEDGCPLIGIIGSSVTDWETLIVVASQLQEYNFVVIGSLDHFDPNRFEDGERILTRLRVLLANNSEALSLFSLPEKKSQSQLGLGGQSIPQPLECDPDNRETCRSNIHALGPITDSAKLPLYFQELDAVFFPDLSVPQESAALRRLLFLPFGKPCVLLSKGTSDLVELRNQGALWISSSVDQIATEIKSALVASVEYDYESKLFRMPSESFPENLYTQLSKILLPQHHL